MTPESAMRLALQQARRASGRTFPNPAVGAVVFRGDRVLGRGYTRPAGGDHAEVVAIRRALRRAGPRGVRGASIAVTLEPCSHRGRTGPCADHLIEAGLARVWVGHRDPHPEVAGRGIRRLRRAGLDVEVGVLAEACRHQHRGFLKVVDRGVPHVTLKLAGSLDGRIATARGESRWITGAPARAAVHRLRAQVDAIAVGAGTALADDPELTARRGSRIVHRPVRVVFDSRLRLPTSARLARGEAGHTWVLCTRSAPAVRRRRLTEAGVRVLPVAADTRGRGRVNLRRALECLAGEGLTHVLVEGGGELAAALLREGWVDEVHWFSAPMLLGGDGRPGLAALSVGRLADAIRLEDVRVRRLGDDVHVSGKIPLGIPAGRRGKGGRS